MYGYYKPPFSVEQEGISISVENDGEHWIYRRTLGTDKVEKIILADGKRLIRNKGRRSAGRENYEGTKKNKREKQYTWKKESQTHFLFLK